MALRTTLMWLCSLAVLSADKDADPTCGSQHFEQLSADLKVAIQCSKNILAGLNRTQTAALLLDMRTLTEILHSHQLSECRGAEPKECPEAEVPQNGGLACVTVANKRYCKPLCNHGYDFGFIRRSRLYEECSEETRHKWTTQYVGGNKLAVCDKSSIQVSGAATAYFPERQDCLTTKASEPLQKSLTDVFASELKNQSVKGAPEHACVVCG